MFKKMFSKTKKPLELTKEDVEWLLAFETVLKELVPREVFELKAVPDQDGKTRFELHTESKRAMVAWAEIQEVLVPTTPPKNLS